MVAHHKSHRGGGHGGHSARIASAHHRLDGGNHNTVGPYNTHGAPSVSTPNKIGIAKHGAGGTYSMGGGHGSGHIHPGEKKLLKKI